MRIQAPFHFHGPPPAASPRTRSTSPTSCATSRTWATATSTTRRLGNVSRPTLVVVGAEDRTTTPRAAHVLHSGIPGSQLVELDGAGHMSMIEAQEPYLAAVKRFLASLG